MDDRGILDLFIARLPGLNSREKILLRESRCREADLIQKSKEDVEQIIGRRIGAFWNGGEVYALAERDAKTARLRGIQWVSWAQAAYPPMLREIYDPPAVLFFRGSLPDPEKPLAAIVGTRRPSSRAVTQTYDIARDLGQRGISVVSGLALGIDAMAHRGNLEGGAPTYAVLGSGVDEVYPSANRHLAKRILETGGALLSEYPPGAGPRKWTFPARNRIISGLARGVLIVEAPRMSGALITAGYALEQGKDIWVASAGASSENSALCDRRGSAGLVQDGAGIIASASDILKEWNWETETPQTNAPAEGEKEIPAARAGGRALALRMAKRLDIEL
jgi:DNA processing protein